MNALLDAPLSPAFADPVHDAQAVFRALLQASSRPGTRVPLPVQVPGARDAGLCPALAALVLTLCDVDTPLHWPAASPAGQAWLRFHVGAPLVDAPTGARFVVAHDAPPALDALDAGTDEAPERSATLLLRLPRLDGGTPLRWRGPGIERTRDVALPLPASFWGAWSAQHARFPLGVDVLMTDGADLIGLPRTTQVTAVERR
jgi:alpha-D-ribose 1-methylphosphonate 5-triphosphate synthase subunit PhnH